MEFPQTVWPTYSTVSYILFNWFINSTNSLFYKEVKTAWEMYLEYKILSGTEIIIQFGDKFLVINKIFSSLEL